MTGDVFVLDSMLSLLHTFLVAGPLLVRGLWKPAGH